MVGAALLRVIAVLGGFFLAVVVGAAVLLSLAGYYVTRLVNNEHLTSLPQFIDNAISLMHGFTAPVTLLPALLVVLIGELASIRSLLYYIVAGGAAAVVMPLVVMAPDGQSGAYSGTYFSLVATAGFAAGLTYWLIAGRRA